MKTIYAVSSGSYSDYRVNQLFESKEDAGRFVERWNSHSRYLDPPYVEEFDLYSVGEQPVTHTHYGFRQYVDKDTLQPLGEPEEWSQMKYGPPQDAPTSGVHDYLTSWHPHPSIKVDGHTDRDKALKALRDRVAQYRAEKLGL